LTHTRYGSSHVHTTGQLTNTRRSDDAPDLDGDLREVVRKRILRYRQLYINRPDPIAFLPSAVDTTGRVYDDFSRLLFLHAHHEDSALSNEIPEESGQFRFLRVVCYVNVKGSVGLILAKASAMRISIPLDLSSRPLIPQCDIFSSLWSSPFFIPMQINNNSVTLFTLGLRLFYSITNKEHNCHA
jgi:hypothetical protein